MLQLFFQYRHHLQSASEQFVAAMPLISSADYGFKNVCVGVYKIFQLCFVMPCENFVAMSFKTFAFLFVLLNHFITVMHTAIAENANVVFVKEISAHKAAEFTHVLLRLVG